MLSRSFETRTTRETLLDIFTDVIGHGPHRTFSVNNLGLWASFLDSAGIAPAEFVEIRHRLAGVGFLNVAIDGHDLDLDALGRQEREAAVVGAHCMMVPCLRDGAVADLIERGYVAIPGMFDCRAHLATDWDTHLRHTLSRHQRREFKRKIRRLGDDYRTDWCTVGDLVDDVAVLAEVSRIYDTTCRKFEFPAVHFPRAVLERISHSGLAHSFRVALTFRGASLVRLVVCFVDERAGYVAGLVHGIDRTRVPDNHNLYCHLYYEVYRFMARHGLSTFDMGRGYVGLKLEMGANVVEPLFAYLKPLDEEARVYVEMLLSKARMAAAANEWANGLVRPSPSRPIVSARANCASR